MKNEKFLQAMSGLDEKFIGEADRDVNAWLNSMEGEVIEAWNVKRDSPLKVMTAAVLAAAAVFGAAVITKNVINRPKPDVSAGSNATLKEQLANYTIKNLNFDKATVIENVPNSGRWQRLEYELPRSVEQSVDQLVAVAADYGVMVDINDIMLEKNRNRSDDVPLPDADLEKNDYTGTYYDSDELYIHVIPSIKDQIELAYKKNVKTVAGAEEIEPYEWRPSDGKVSERFVHPNDESKTCVLDGKTVKVADALRNAEKMISESDLFPKEFAAKVTNYVRVYTYENGNQGLWIELTYSLDGIPYMKSSSPLGFDYSETNIPAYSPTVYFGMLTENSIDWILQFRGFAETESTHQDCEINISQDDALKLVSMNLDQNDMFIVEEMQLVYAERFTDNGKTLYIEPTWVVRYSYDEGWRTRIMYVFVSATDGTVEESGGRQAGFNPNVYQQ